LPPRVIGSLANDAGATILNVTVTGQDKPSWSGATDGNWDIDDGGGTGTLNWKENHQRRTHPLHPDGDTSDTVLFDDGRPAPRT
jgi:hypothetical protein